MPIFIYQCIQKFLIKPRTFWFRYRRKVASDFSWALYFWPEVTVTAICGENIGVLREWGETWASAAEAHTSRRSNYSYSAGYVDRSFTHFKECYYPRVWLLKTDFKISEQHEYRALRGSFISKKRNPSPSLLTGIWFAIYLIYLCFWVPLFLGRISFLVSWSRRGMCGLKWSTPLPVDWPECILKTIHCK